MGRYQRHTEEERYANVLADVINECMNLFLVCRDTAFLPCTPIFSLFTDTVHIWVLA